VVELAARQAGAVGDVVGDAAVDQRRQLRDERHLASQGERVAPAHVGPLVEDGAGVGIGQPV
jgi:hypothetical protein